MAIKPETRRTRDIIEYIKTTLDGDAYHVHGSIMQRSGEPDISGEVCINGVWLHLKLEVKTPSGTPSKLQLERLRRYHRAGYVTGIITSIAGEHGLIQLLHAYSLWRGVGVSMENYGLLYGTEIYGADTHDDYS